MSNILIGSFPAPAEYPVVQTFDLSGGGRYYRIEVRGTIFHKDDPGKVRLYFTVVDMNNMNMPTIYVSETLEATCMLGGFGKDHLASATFSGGNPIAGGGRMTSLSPLRGVWSGGNWNPVEGQWVSGNNVSCQLYIDFGMTAGPAGNTAIQIIGPGGGGHIQGAIQVGNQEVDSIDIDLELLFWLIVETA